MGDGGEPTTESSTNVAQEQSSSESPQRGAGRELRSEPEQRTVDKTTERGAGSQQCDANEDKFAEHSGRVHEESIATTDKKGEQRSVEKAAESPQRGAGRELRSEPEQRTVDKTTERGAGSQQCDANEDKFAEHSGRVHEQSIVKPNFPAFLNGVRDQVTVSNWDHAIEKGAIDGKEPPPNLQVKFASEFEKDVKDGLTRVAVAVMPWLGKNSTTTLALKKEQFGGNDGVYRFTYLERESQNGKLTREFLIERLGEIGPEGMDESKLKAAQENVDACCKLTGNWKPGELARSVLPAIQIISEKRPELLTQLKDITFERQPGVNTENPQAYAVYKDQSHSITIYDPAFEERSSVRFGTEKEGFSTNTIREVLHEIGHAVDRAPVREKANKVNELQQQARKDFAEYWHEESQQYNFSGHLDAHDRYFIYQSAINQAEAKHLRARTESGYRDEARHETNRETGARTGRDVYVSVDGVRAGDSNKFRDAAIRDGNPTQVMAPFNLGWKEYYAEAFSLYITDPETLRQIRPNVYAFFEEKRVASQRQRP